MRFAVSLSACPKCGAPGPTKVDFYGDGNLHSYLGPCPGCNEPRNFNFQTDGDPMNLPTFHRHHLGDSEPSTIIEPEQLAAELRRLDSRRPQPAHGRPHPDARPDSRVPRGARRSEG
jgi:hypothetical protein